jgi:carbamoyltransferase
VFFEKPFLKFERLLLTCMQTFPRSRRLFQEAMIPWLGDKVWIRHLLQKRLGLPPAKILFSEHHLSHAASAFFCSPFHEAAILTVDGVGEWTTATVGIGRGTGITMLEEIRFPHSLGLLYSAFTAFLGFEVNEGEYKVMGMAPFGVPRHVDRVWKLIRASDDGGFELDMSYFEFHRSTERTYSDRFVELFGAPRDPSAPFFTAASGYPSYFGPRAPDHAAQAERNQYYADLASSVQAVIEEVILRMARYVHRRTGLPRLCMAGGVALNSVANGRVLREGPFEEVYVQPAAGDSGGALGAALWGYHAVLGQPRGFVMEHASWGRAYERPEAGVLEGAGVAYTLFDDEDRLLDHVVAGSGRAASWAGQGRFSGATRARPPEHPRDPRRPEMDP